MAVMQSPDSALAIDYMVMLIMSIADAGAFACRDLSALARHGAMMARPSHVVHRTIVLG